MTDLFRLKPAAVAAYPMYRGVARAVGMQVFEAEDGIEGLAQATRNAVADHDFVYVHYKTTDSRGEDGDFEAKVKEIETADRVIERLLENEFDVVMVTGDHSTPAAMAGHSWHPVPVLISGGPCRANAGGNSFGETDCLQGALGTFPSMDLLPLVLAQAGRIGKFGA